MEIDIKKPVSILLWLIVATFGLSLALSVLALLAVVIGAFFG